MKVVIDGYNLFHYVKGQAEPEEALTLGSFLEVLGQWASRSKNDVLVVFDGKGPPALRSQGPNLGRLGVQFAGPSTTADDAIIGFVETYSAPRTVLIVSTDRGSAGPRRSVTAK